MKKSLRIKEKEGYSRDGDWEARGRFRDSYGDGGNFYARHGEHYVRGHYSRNSGHMYSRSDGRKRLEEGLEEMMQGAEGEHREIIRRTLEEIRNG